MKCACGKGWLQNHATEHYTQETRVIAETPVSLHMSLAWTFIWAGWKWSRATMPLLCPCGLAASHAEVQLSALSSPLKTCRATEGKGAPVVDQQTRARLAVTHFISHSHFLRCYSFTFSAGKRLPPAHSWLCIPSLPEIGDLSLWTSDS